MIADDEFSDKEIKAIEKALNQNFSTIGEEELGIWKSSRDFYLSINHLGWPEDD